MNRFIKTAIATTALTLVGLSANAETKLIANDPGANRGVRAKAVTHLSEEITKRSGGKITVEQNWGGALFKAKAALDSLSNGVADMGVIVGPYAQSELPELNIGAQPLPPADPWVMMRAMHELFTTNEAIIARLAAKNLVYMNFYSLPPNLFACKGAGVNTIADLKGKKISRTGSSSDLFKELGGNMVDMTIYKVYQNMQTGLIECTVTFSYFAVATKLHELLSSVATMGLSAQTVVATVMNKDSFDGLSADEQKVVREAGTHMVDYYGEQLSGADERAMSAMAKAGVKTNEFSAGDLESIKNASKPQLTKWFATAKKTGLDGEAVYDQLIKLIAKYNKVVETKGYPWSKS